MSEPTRLRLASGTRGLRIEPGPRVDGRAHALVVQVDQRGPAEGRRRTLHSQAIAIGRAQAAELHAFLGRWLACDAHSPDVSPDADGVVGTLARAAARLRELLAAVREADPDLCQPWSAHDVTPDEWPTHRHLWWVDVHTGQVSMTVAEVEHPHAAAITALIAALGPPVCAALATALQIAANEAPRNTHPGGRESAAPRPVDWTALMPAARAVNDQHTRLTRPRTEQEPPR